MIRDAVQSALDGLSTDTPHLRKTLGQPTRWAESFVQAAYRMVLGREPDAAGLSHAATMLTREPQARARVVGGLRAAPDALQLPPAPAVPLEQQTLATVLDRLHEVHQSSLRSDLYLIEVLAAVESLTYGLPDVLDAALARSAERRALDRSELGRSAFGRAAARSITCGEVTVLDVDGLLVAVPASRWQLAARLALQGDPHDAVQQHVLGLLDAAEDPVLVDVSSGVDAGLAALRAAKAGAQVHLVEPSRRLHEILSGSFALNGLAVAGLHASPAEAPRQATVVRVHCAIDAIDAGEAVDAGKAVDLDGLLTGAAAGAGRVVLDPGACTEEPVVAGWSARGVPGAEGAWELTPAARQ